MGYSKPHDGAFWTQRFGQPSGVEHWHVYAYEYLDDLDFMPVARETLGDLEQADETLKAVEEQFREMGWEGDGELQVLWLPPFAGAGPHDDFGCYASRKADRRWYFVDRVSVFVTVRSIVSTIGRSLPSSRGN